MMPHRALEHKERITVSLFTRKPKPTAGDLAPAVSDAQAAEDARYEALEAKIDALAAMLRTIPDLTDMARRWLCDYVYDGGHVDAYQAGYTHTWMLDITMPGATHNRVWTARAFSAYAAGEHPDTGRDLCMCEPCVSRRIDHAMMHGVLGIPDPNREGGR